MDEFRSGSECRIPDTVRTIMVGKYRVSYTMIEPRSESSGCASADEADRERLLIERSLDVDLLSILCPIEGILRKGWPNLFYFNRLETIQPNG